MHGVTTTKFVFIAFCVKSYYITFLQSGDISAATHSKNTYFIMDHLATHVQHKLQFMRDIRLKGS